MKNRRVSVAMCTYNGERFLDAQLQSISQQTRLPDEMIVCDDGSSDKTIELLDDFARAATFPVRVVPSERRLGPAQNFAQAIAICAGDIIVLSDQDDIWKREKLKKLSDVFDDESDSPFAFSDADMIDADGSPVGQSMWHAVGLIPGIDDFSGTEQFRRLLKQNLIVGASLAFRASFRSVFLPVPRGWMHDYWIVMLGAALSSGVSVPDRLLEYRRHSGQVCGWRKQGLGRAVRDSIAADGRASAGKVDQFCELRRRLESLHLTGQVPADRLALIMGKETHLRTRASLRSLTVSARLGGVFEEALTGRYGLFSNSWHSILRDLT